MAPGGRCERWRWEVGHVRVGGYQVRCTKVVCGCSKWLYM